VNRSFRREAEENQVKLGKGEDIIPPRIKFESTLNKKSKDWLLKQGTIFGIKVTFDLGETDE